MKKLLKHYNDFLREFYYLKGELFWVMIAMAFQLTGQLFTIKMLTHLLLPSVYGSVNLIVSILQLFQLVFFSPFLQAAGRIAPEYQAQGLYLSPFEISKKMWRYLWGLTIFVGIVGLVYFMIIKQFQAILIIIIGAVLLWVELKRDYYFSLGHINRQRRVLALYKALDIWGRVLVMWLMLSAFGYSVESVLISWLITSAALLMPFGKKILSHVKNHYDFSVISSIQAEEIKYRLFSFALPFGFVCIFSWMQTWVDRWVVSELIGRESVGILAVATQLGSIPFTVLSGIIINFSGPILYHQMGTNKGLASHHLIKLNIKKIYCTYSCLSILGLIFVYLYSKSIVDLFLSSAYQSIDNLLFFVAAGWFLFNFSQLQSLSMMVLDNTKGLVTPNIFSGIVSLLANLVLVPDFGILGAAYSLIISCLVRISLISFMNRLAWKPKSLILEPFINKNNRM